jgi:hypothetical protein
MFIYIMGRPHSGSTILDIVLGNSAAVESVGELVSGLGRELTGDLCACGATIRDCLYWQKVREAFASSAPFTWDEARDASVRHAHVRNLPHTLLALTSSRRMRFLGTASAEIGRAVGAVSGKPHVLDSSKEPTRGLMLLRFCPDSQIIHLVRDPRRAVASHYWRFHKHGGYFKFLRRVYHAPYMLVPFMFLAAASWTVGNLICEIGRWIAPDRMVRVRYEDLCEQPEVELERIASSLGVPLDDLIGKLARKEELPIGHNLGGNQIRHDKQVIFNPEKGRIHGLPGWLVGLTFAACWPLMLAYGYRMRERSELASVSQSD